MDEADRHFCRPAILPSGPAMPVTLMWRAIWMPRIVAHFAEVDRLPNAFAT